MRVYIPATLAMLQTLNSTGELVPVGGTAFALTPALREAYTAGDDEELAEAAMREAARASLRLLDGDVSEPEASEPQTALPPRRVVVAADVDDATLRPDLDAAVVRLAGPVPRASIAAVHVDGADAEAAVRAAVAAVDAADLGDLDAELAIGDVEDYDLGWYATQELPFLLELL
ncbi:hypothetical protein GOARA_050_00340 [Gordonia araii NBRC 100433]|uniref:Uncharacterized protein n=1 Tax=Gordonia araii NBRC 100433 TaxID=1073574 RepID=G7H297_9ACTN|nr:hypothetical protein [Gordonia araii]NNG97511.1 hypothetical protein [Gordonia araii NBRC 100433]GAB09972.1 hypothetical protein GOARA_050_00340 [Gordonia araii NBRC 100433]